MRKSLVIGASLLVAACFKPVGAPAREASTSAAAADATVTSNASGAKLDVGTIDADTTAATSGADVPTGTSHTMSMTTSGAPLSELDAGGHARADLPPACEHEPGAAWGACGDGGACATQDTCWLASSGWVCVPTCRSDTECVGECALGASPKCDAGRCRAACTGPDAEPCLWGSQCDAASGACVWPSDCGPGPGKGAWHPCGPGNECPVDTYCIADGKTSVCVPSCPCPFAAVVCDTTIGPVECGDADLCKIVCDADAECPAGMRCGAAGACAWPG